MCAINILFCPTELTHSLWIYGHVLVTHMLAPSVLHDYHIPTNIQLVIWRIAATAPRTSIKHVCCTCTMDHDKNQQLPSPAEAVQPTVNNMTQVGALVLYDSALCVMTVLYAFRQLQETNGFSYSLIASNKDYVCMMIVQ